MILSSGKYCIKKKDYSERCIGDLRRAVPLNHIFETDKYILIPRFYGTKLFGAPSRDLRADPWIIDGFPRFTGILRDYQEEIVSKYLSGDDLSGILKVGCAGGKTCMAIAIASRLGTRTLIVVDRGYLVTYWSSEIRKFLGPEVKINTGVDSHFDIRVINGLIGDQEKINAGLVILDECHIYNSKVFSRVYWKVAHIKRVIGLSATPGDLDATSPLSLHIGTVLAEYLRNYAGRLPKVYMLNYLDMTGKYQKMILSGVTNRPNHTEIVNNISKDPARLKLALKVIEKLAGLGYRILVISSRKELLITLNESLCHNYSVGLFCNVSGKDLDCALTRQIILGISAMAIKSLSIEDVNAMVLLSTFKKQEILSQLVGRVLRKAHSEPPVIVDFVDQFSYLRGHGFKRSKFYRTQGYEVRNISGVNGLLQTHEEDKSMKSNNMLVLKDSDIDSGSED